MNYTKGKWEVYEGHDGQFKDEPYIVVPPTKADPRECSPTIARVIHVTGHTESNAQLISAAPELYQALKKFNEYLQSTYPENLKLKAEATELMEQALLKAEGVK